MKKIFTTLVFILLGLTNKANNIEVKNISLENLNEAEGWVQVEFDLSWENSWRTSVGPANWDAAWVFVKFRNNGGDWEHAQLNRINTVAPTGSVVNISSDNVGAMVYRDTDGSGNIELADIQLRWDYGEVTTSDILDVQVFAIEMVYVPEGPFSVGVPTGGFESYVLQEGNNLGQPYEVTSEDPINISNNPGDLFYNNSNGGDQTGSLSVAFPKGYQGFYSMKYEASQYQWVSFFNTLTPAQKITLDITGPNGRNSPIFLLGNAISWGGGSASAVAFTPNTAVNFIDENFFFAYLDWAGLRPMTELEFEKASRGPITPRAGEYPWGTSNIAITEYTVQNPGEPNEQISNLEEGAGNACYEETNRSFGNPMRNGIFAASAINSSREETGGSYYGIMELGGNLYETCITIGLPGGRNFTGLHGNGILTGTGNADVELWPTSGNTGVGLKGGSNFTPARALRISDRTLIISSIAAFLGESGLRGVRTTF